MTYEEIMQLYGLNTAANNQVPPVVSPLASGDQIRQQIGDVPERALMAGTVTNAAVQNAQSNRVRAMAYGPSQNEFTHDTLNGPLGKLQPGDIAISPNLLKQHPLGSYVQIQPEKGDPFIGRVADYSYIKPGQPTKNSIELWNGQDMGHVSISQSPPPNASSPSRSSMFGYAPPPVSGGTYAQSGSNPAMMSTWQDYDKAQAQQTAQDKATQQGIGIIQSSLARAAQAQTAGQSNPLAMLQQKKPLAAYAPVPFPELSLYG